MTDRLTTWAEVGARVAAARTKAGLTQREIADRLGVDRTAVVRLERGERQLDALELAQLAETLGRSVEWFVTQSPAGIASYRRERGDETELEALDDGLETLVRDVEFLGEIGELTVEYPLPEAPSVNNVEDAEHAAARAREALGDSIDGPLLGLQGACERIGLYAFSLSLDANEVDGGYVALDGCGVALVNGDKDPGRRRFNLAHEIGHHMLADEYSADFGVGQPRSDREKLIDAFAVHLLMPRGHVLRRWRELNADVDWRSAAIRLAAEYRVSWTALYNHLRNLDLIDADTRRSLASRPPTAADHMELGIYFGEELTPPRLPSTYAAAVFRAYRHHKIGAQRTVELLHGTVTLDDLQPPDELPLDALRQDLEPHLER